MSILSTNGRPKLVKNRVFDCLYSLTGNKWQSKTLFLAIFDLHSSIVKSFFDCSLSGVETKLLLFFLFIFFFFLLLYVPSQQLWSLRDGQFT